MYRGTFAIIDETAIRDNVAAIRERIGRHVKLLVAVKANGYGHGMQQAASAALAGGADWFGVATLEEAVELRGMYPDVPILIFGVVSPAACQVAANYGVDVTLTDDWSQLADVPVFSPPLRVHLKLDTGMTRLGFRKPEPLQQVARWLVGRSDIQVAGVFSHLACADDEQLDHARSQIERFEALVQPLRDNNLVHDAVVVHVANSAATLRVPEWHYDMVRLGISAYGFPPSDGFEIPVPLRQAMHLYSFITRIADVDVDESVGYGATFRTSRKSRIATVPIGYGDGYSRHLSNLGYVLVKGQRAPVVGNVCMDQLMIDVTEISDVSPEDCVTLYGRSAPREWTFSRISALSEAEQMEYLVNSFRRLVYTSPEGSERTQEVSIHQLAKLAGTISYELVCALSNRVPHLYATIDEHCSNSY